MQKFGVVVLRIVEAVEVLQEEEEEEERRVQRRFPAPRQVKSKENKLQYLKDYMLKNN